MTSLPFMLHQVGLLAAIMWACTCLPAGCLEQKKAEAVKLAEPSPAAAEMRQFCANNVALVGDARIAWQTSKLLELETQIKQHLAELETRKTELVEWLRKHDEAMKKATDDVVAIYAHMKPEAAASQIAAMDDVMAAAVIAKLPPRVAGTIFNEMEPARAVQLTHGMLAPGIESARKKS